MSWRETFRLDLGELGWEGARWDDEDQEWWDVATSDSWEPDRGVGGWNFLDPEGMRYYLPTGMVWELRTGFEAHLLYQLQFRGLFVVERRPLFSRGWRPEHLKLLTEEQMAAIGEFAYFQAFCRKSVDLINGRSHLFGLEHLEFAGWKKAYRTYWQKWHQ